MIHTSKPFDSLTLSAIPYPIYVPKEGIPKEFLVNAFGELALSKVYAREIMTYTQPFIY